MTGSRIRASELFRIFQRPSALTILDQQTLAENPRPQVRADCLPGGCNEERPCPWAGCQYHLATNVNHNGSLRVLTDWNDGQATCALDVADQGMHLFEEVGELIGVTKQRVQQIEESALRRLGRVSELQRANKDSRE